MYRSTSKDADRVAGSNSDPHTYGCMCGQTMPWPFLGGAEPMLAAYLLNARVSSSD
jgi:hypothetical protein